MRVSDIEVVRHEGVHLSADRRVILRSFLPGSSERIRKIIDRVLSMSADAVACELEWVIREFGTRHRNLHARLLDHFEYVREHIPNADSLSDEHRMLIGAYFSNEYSIEAAALFNPSIVPHPDQQGMPDGVLRFIMSLRATGEGHVSSIVFRTGTVTREGKVEIEPVSPFAQHADPIQDRLHNKQRFFLKLIEMGAYTDAVGDVLDVLSDEFSRVDLDEAIDKVGQGRKDKIMFDESADQMRWLSRSNYHLTFESHCNPSEIVIFPVNENESRGIEDARFVQFTGDDGKRLYYGTYTAYNGFKILPQLLETDNFVDFRVTTLSGRYVQNKGMALFPRMIDGWYMMVSRIDGENVFMMKSKNIRFWNEAEVISEPTYPWEFVQIGNCGSPIETKAGWLLLTHGVGPIRTYSIGALLLDLDDPTRVIGHLKDPLLIANDAERDGYVPNVVYSCGALAHNGQLVLPYAMSDSATGMATVRMDQLLDMLTRNH